MKVAKALAELLESKAEESKLLAKLWAMDPAAYGTDNEGVQHEAGRSDGLRRAARMVREYLVEDPADAG